MAFGSIHGRPAILVSPDPCRRMRLGFEAPDEFESFDETERRLRSDLIASGGPSSEVPDLFIRLKGIPRKTSTIYKVFWYVCEVHRIQLFFFYLWA